MLIAKLKNCQVPFEDGCLYHYKGMRWLYLETGHYEVYPAWLLASADAPMLFDLLAKDMREPTTDQIGVFELILNSNKTEQQFLVCLAFGNEKLSEALNELDYDYMVTVTPQFFNIFAEDTMLVPAETPLLLAHGPKSDVDAEDTLLVFVKEHEDGSVEEHAFTLELGPIFAE